MPIRPGVRIVVDRAAEVGKAIAHLSATRVMVGFPEAQSARDGEGPSNAELGYIHDNGAPEARIPARPFMMPGVKRNDEKIQRRLKAAAKAAFDGDSQKMDRNFVAVGMETVSTIREVITEGIPPPLADATLRARIARRKTGRLGERRELIRREMGKEPGMGLAVPLIDTGEMRHKVTFAIRKAKVG